MVNDRSEVTTTGSTATDGASGRLRESVRGDWDAAVTHPFVRELFAETLPTAKLRRYLVQDYQFVDAFIALLGAAVACANSTAARLVIARQLGMTASTENTYFERAFDTLEVPEDQRATPELLPPTAEFSTLMREVAASLDYPSCLSVLTVAEWLYLDWARRAPRPLPADPIAREWIEIHDNPEFRAWIGFLRDELDAAIQQLPAASADRCADLFATAARLELRFFEATYRAGR